MSNSRNRITSTGRSLMSISMWNPSGTRNAFLWFQQLSLWGFVPQPNLHDYDAWLENECHEP